MDHPQTAFGLPGKQTQDSICEEADRGWGDVCGGDSVSSNIRGDIARSGGRLPGRAEAGWGWGVIPRCSRTRESPIISSSVEGPGALESSV